MGITLQVPRGWLCLMACGGIIALAPAGSHAGTIVMSVSASDNSTIKPAGPRTGSGNSSYFNAEGNNNSANASFGVLDFPGSGFRPSGTVSSINSLKLDLIESDAAFSAPGALNFYLTRDTTTNITNTGSPSTPNYQSASNRDGIGSQFDPRTLIGTGTFDTSGNTNTGQDDTYTLTLNPSGEAYVIDQINKGQKLRLIVAPGADDTAATYAGALNATLAAPLLTIDAESTPEPGGLSIIAITAIALGARRRRRGASRTLPVHRVC